MTSTPTKNPPPDPDAAPHPATSPGAFDRRSVLLAGVLGAAGLACERSATAETPTSAKGAPKEALKEPAKDAPKEPEGPAAFLPVLVALAARLLPDDDTGPGARAAGVDGFFARVFDDPRLGSIHPLLKRGCAFVMRAAQASHGRAFVALSAEEQDDLIARLVDGKMRPDGFSGPTFVRVVLALTLEGFLGDPRHGGNRDAVGWRFVGFSPDGRTAGLALPVLPGVSAPRGTP
jgi:gluconate 2-dehydrogenase gamma chain